MELYREVKASERLPEKAGFYITIFDSGSSALRIFDGQKFNDKKSSWWLESIEITEEEIEEMCTEMSRIKELDGAIHGNAKKYRIEGAKAILSKLKGDEKK